MTREECLAYRQRCPYDAMGDFSVFRRKRKIAGIMKWLLHSRNYQNKIKHKKFMWQ